MRVLVLAPHMDDEVLGCGGAIMRHVASGDQVTVCILTERAYGHAVDQSAIQRNRGECLAAQGILGYECVTFCEMSDERVGESFVSLLAEIELIAGRVRPTLVYLPHGGDINQDHQATHSAALIAFRAHGPHGKAGLRVYEVPSSTYVTTGRAFSPNLFVEICEVIDRKVEALRCYKGEIRPSPHPRSAEGLKLLAAYRGGEAGLVAAEAFVSLREVWTERSHDSYNFGGSPNSRNTQRGLSS